MGGTAEGLRTLKEGASATDAEIKAFCRDRLAHYKCPDAIEFRALPKTSTGKVQKFALREPEFGTSGGSTEGPRQPELQGKGVGAVVGLPHGTRSNESPVSGTSGGRIPCADALS